MPVMTDERKAIILKVLQNQGRVVAADLSTDLGVSEDTVRRDLRDLADQGLLRRVHGGALPAAVPMSPVFPKYSSRINQSTDAKHAIGRAASAMISAGQTIIIDGGTTPLRVAEAISPELPLTVITHSLPVAMTLAKHRAVQLFFVGGAIFNDYLSTRGALTVAGYRPIHADLCILGVASVHPFNGVAVLDAEDAEVKRAIIGASTKVICVASSEKLNTAAPFTVAPLSAIHHLVTDKNAEEAFVKTCADAGLEVTCA
jgi:DeoR/GlpR family transcriptional regulator of sugar metabolism